MIPGTYNIKITRADTLRKTFTWKAGSLRTPVDLTGASVKMRVQTKAGVELFTLDSATPGSDGEITLGGTAGTIDVWVKPAGNSQTVAVHEYDLQVTLASGDVNTIIKGTYEILKEITV